MKRSRLQGHVGPGNSLTISIQDEAKAFPQKVCPDVSWLHLYLCHIPWHALGESPAEVQREESGGGRFQPTAMPIQKALFNMSSK